MTIHTELILFLALLTGHALADYPLQGEWIAKAKNPNFMLPVSLTVSIQAEKIWLHVLFFHGLIHGAFVYLITHNLGLGLSEIILHMFIDYNKCKGKIGYNTDQALHVICKVWWLVLMCWFPNETYISILNLIL